MKTIDVVIVNWNSGTLLRECIQSLELARTKEAKVDRVVIVDNDSHDGSAEIPADSSLPIVLIQNRGNRGFAAACNQGARNSRADMLLFLNPDTRVLSNSLDPAIAYLSSAENKRVGIVGIQLLDDSMNVARSCCRFPTPSGFLIHSLGLDILMPRVFVGRKMLEWDHKDTREVEQLMGAFFLVRRNVFEVLNGFDERFFVYFEEVDFSYRARELGWSSVYVSNGQVVHKGCGTSSQAVGARMFYSLRSRVLYAEKHFSTAAMILVIFTTALIEPFSRIAAACLKRSWATILHTIRAYAQFWKWLPTLWRKSTPAAVNARTL